LDRRVAFSICAALLGIAPGWSAERIAEPRRASPSIRYASDFGDADVGRQINAAYAALPDGGGQIVVDESGSFATPVVFSTPGKPVLLTGIPGDVVNLTWTGTGPAMIFDYGTGHRMGHGMRDLTLTGPGNSTATIGVIFGGKNGAEGIDFRDFKIQSFGVNLQMGSHTWLANFEHGMLRDGGINVLLPSGLVEAGEQIAFHHVTFADAPPPHTNSVWVQGQGQEIVFTDCSFDQAQLHIGKGSFSAAQVVVQGSHFENPNWSWPGSVPYDYILLDESPGNLLRLSDSYFLQAAHSGGPAQFLMVWAGRVMLCGNGMYTTSGSPVRNFAVAAEGAWVENWGFDDLSANLRGPIVGKY
jgi:hypothetical protein